MKKVALLLASLVAAPAFAQLPTLPLPSLPSLPSLPTLPAPPAASGSIDATANGTGVIVSFDTTATPPVTVTPVGLPGLPGL